MSRNLLFASIAITATASLLPGQLLAGGLYLNEAGTGAGNPANHRTASAAWMNPAGMTGLDESAVVASMGFLVPWVEFDPSVAEAGGDDGNNAGTVAALPTMYAVKKMSDSWALGFTMTAPFGGGVDYGDDFVGRYGAQRAMLSGVGIGPSLGFKVNDKLSLGAGVQFQYTKFDMKFAINTGAGLPDGTAKINSIDGWGEQYYAGLTYTINPRTMLGITYKSDSDIEIDGDFEIGNVPLPIQPAKIEVDFTNPQLVAIGLEHVINDHWILYMDVDWEDWSQFSQNQFTASFVNGVAAVNVIDRQWKDTWHGGAALTYLSGKNIYSVGFSYDTSPVSDSNRTIDMPLDEVFKFVVGAMKPGKQLDYGVGATVLYLGDNKVDETAQGVRFAGEFDPNILLILGATLNYRF